MKDSHEIHVYAAVSKSMPFILKTFSVTRFSFIFLFLWHSLNNFLVLWVFKDVQFCCLLSLGFSVPSVYLCAGYTFVSFVLLTWPVSRKKHFTLSWWSSVKSIQSIVAGESRRLGEWERLQEARRTTTAMSHCRTL